MAFCGATLGIMAVMLLAIRGGPSLMLVPHSAGTSVFRLFGYLGLFLSTVLILRVVITITHDGTSLMHDQR